MINLNFLPFIIVLLGFSVDIYAVKMDAKDISNNIITCDNESPLLKDFPVGTCVKIPDNTVEVTLEQEDTDKAEDLENLHIVVEDKGEYFHYNAEQNGKWLKFGFNEFAPGVIPLPASFTKLPFETNIIVRPIHLGELANKKGAKLIVGMKSKSNQSFKNKNVRYIYTVR